MRAHDSSIFRATPIPGWIVDPATLEIAEANEAAAGRYGYSIVAFCGLPLASFFEHADEQLFDEMRRRERFAKRHSRHVTYSGEILDVELMCEPLKLGGRDMVLVMALDVTEQMRAESDLECDEEQYRSLIEKSTDIIYSTDTRGLFTFTNPAATRVLGFERSELVGRHFADVIHPDWRKRARDHYRGQFESRLHQTYFEFPCLTNDGREVWIGQHVQAIFRDDEIVGFQAIARDISDARALETVLAEARDAALTTARLKADFLANMSHEIRTPMNGVLGMLGVLLDSKLDEDQRDVAETARTSAESLLTLINDILDFSKIEAGKLTFETADFDLRDSIEAVIDLVADSARRKSIEIGCAIDGDVPRTLRGDAGRLRQVLLNLVGNAIKFTDTGGVVVRVSLASAAKNRAQLLVRVTDTGIGISEKTAKSLFEPFVQADASTTRRFGGTGLGLAICKQLVLLMDGEIGVESEVGNGSTFWFTSTFEASQMAPEAIHLTDLPRVLIVDDSSTTRNLMSVQLSSWDLPNDVAADSSTAIAMLRAAAEKGTPYRVVLSDLNMPGIDGTTLSRLIRAQSVLGNPRFIMMSSAAAPTDRASHEQTGVAVWLSKPVKQRQLQAAIFSNPVVHRSAARVEAVESAPTEVVSAGARILVVEDNAVNQKVALRQLQKMGYSADAVANGLEAVDVVARIRYDLILMDCHMPEMDGYEATAAIRQSEKPGTRIPIIALTASAQQEDRDRCLAAGMDDFVTKPVRASELKKALARWLGSALSSEVIENLRDLSGGDELFLRELFSTFVDYSDGIMAELSRGDHAGFGRAMHALGGSSGNIGAMRLADLCRVAELEARKDAQASYAAHFAAVRAACADVRREIVSKLIVDIAA